MLALFLVLCGRSPALELRMHGDRITLRADDVPLREVLERFSRYGVEVEVQDGVEATVSGDLVNAPVDEALQILLKDFGHITRWRDLHYASGTVHVLTGIGVYRVGTPARMIALAAPAPRRVVRPIDGSPAYVADELLVRIAAGAELEDFLRVVEGVGGQFLGADRSTQTARIRLPEGADVPATARRLAESPVVGAAEPNFVYEIPSPQVSSADTPTPSANKSRQTQAGKGPALAILDSGLSPDYHGASFLAGSLNATEPSAPLSDPAGHGTQMALVGSGSVTPHGATPTGVLTPVLAIQTFDAQGITSTFDLLASLAYARQQEAQVVSMSWGSTADSVFLRDALAQASRQGLILVAAAGNERSREPVYPAAYADVLSVAAATADGSPWQGSNYGASVDLMAPGTASLPIGHQGPPGEYAGTSIATPWVAAALATYLNRYPEADAETAVRALLDALSPHNEKTPANLYGAGVFDAAAQARLLSD